jgi:hypothetical protein
LTAPLRNNLADEWVKIDTIALKPEIKRHVVDPCDNVVDLFQRNADVMREG